MNDGGAIQMIRLVLDRRETLRIATRHRLPPGTDDGAILHAGLAELFARSSERAAIPLHNFAVDDTVASARGRPDLLFLLGYSPFDAHELMRLMGPARGRLLMDCQSRAVPHLPTGFRAGFRVRVCPVVRTRRLGDRERPSDRQGKPRPVEIDAWLAFRHASGGGVTERPAAPFAHAASVWTEREQVYGAWLARELGGEGGAALEEPPRLVAFQRTAMRRRAKDSRRTLERPDATLEGVIRIIDAVRFRARLLRGVGRHRAFGFGMLLLHPARRDAAAG